MAFWANLFGRENRDPENIKANDGGPDTFNPGDPDGVELIGELLESRSLPGAVASGWDGWPANWDTPSWATASGITRLVDIAWAALDLNSNIVSAMPVYRLKNSQIIKPTPWMLNPDPTIYASWSEFMKQLFWDYQLGEAFILPFSTDSTNKPSSFRIIPPWLINVEFYKGLRRYDFAGHDVTDEVLHLRYMSNTINPRGIGPLEVAGAKMTHIALLQRYAQQLAETGGVPLYWLGIERRLAPSEAKDLLETWVETRSANPAHPAILGSKATLNQAKSMTATEMGLLEMQEFSESRISVLLGVPPFLLGLAGAPGGGGGSRMVYSNVSDIFDFHDRSSLRPKVVQIMSAISNWALVGNETAELNRDDYTRLSMDKRAAVYKILGPVEAGGIGVLSVDEIRVMERFYGDAAASALSGNASGVPAPATGYPLDSSGIIGD